MNKKTPTRLLAFLLAVLMTCSMFTFEMFAAEGDTAADSSSTTQTEETGSSNSLESIKEMLTEISYVDYLDQHADAKPASKEFVINAVDDFVAEKTDEKANATIVNASDYEGDGKAISIGESGKVTWTAEVPSTGMYYMEVEYYPIAYRATAIERAFSIDGKVPYSEARYLTFTKVWKE